MSEDGNKKSNEQGSTGAVGPTVPGARGVPKSARQHTLVGFPTEKGAANARQPIAPLAGAPKPATPRPASGGAWSSKKPDAPAKPAASSTGAASAFKVPTPGQVVPKGRRPSQARMPAAGAAKKPGQPRTPVFGADKAEGETASPAMPSPATASPATASPATGTAPTKPASAQQTMGQGPSAGAKKKEMAFAKTLMMSGPGVSGPGVAAPVAQTESPTAPATQPQVTPQPQTEPETVEATLEPQAALQPQTEPETVEATLEPQAALQPQTEPETRRADLSKKAAASMDPVLSSSPGVFDGTGQTMPPPAGFSPSEVTASASEAAGDEPFDPTADTAPPPAQPVTAAPAADVPPTPAVGQPPAAAMLAAPLVPPKGPPTADHAVMPVPGRATPAPFEAPRAPSAETALPDYDSTIPEAMTRKKGGRGLLYTGLAAAAAMGVAGFVMFGTPSEQAPPTGPVGTQPSSAAPSEEAATAQPAAEAMPEPEAEAVTATETPTPPAADEDGETSEEPETAAAPAEEAEPAAATSNVAITLPEVPPRIERMNARKRQSGAVRHLRHANRLMSQRKWESAKRSLDEALALDPESATNSAAMSRWALQGQNDPALALAWAERATTLSPNSAPAYVALGAALEAQNKPKDALKAYEQALRSSRRHPVAKRKVRALRRATR